jgi:hypothetical protein
LAQAAGTIRALPSVGGVCVNMRAVLHSEASAETCLEGVGMLACCWPMAAPTWGVVRRVHGAGHGAGLGGSTPPPDAEPGAEGNQHHSHRTARCCTCSSAQRWGGEDSA